MLEEYGWRDGVLGWRIDRGSSRVIGWRSAGFLGGFEAFLFGVGVLGPCAREEIWRRK